MKRARLRSKSPKTAREDRQLAAERKAYAELHGKQEVHEVVGGMHRSVTKGDRRFWLAVDRVEHGIVQYESKARQMARKLCQDGEFFDLERVNDVYRVGGSEWPITFAQIGEELRIAIENGGF